MEMVFRKIEYLIDGDRNEQIALKKRPWDAYKIRKRVTKIISFFILSFVIANFFLMYILGSKEVLNIIFEPIELHITGLVLIFVFSFVFFFVYYWFREQVCLIVCPYGRLQSVMLDKNSITVAYDHVRGEPRTKNFKKSDNHGSCVDCFECVRVCPTGIDIRNGIQLECINCTACMDVCDQVMDKTHQPQGLIRYASVNSVIDGKKLHITKRIFSYSLVLVVLIALEAFLLATRSDVEINTMRTRNTLFTTEKDGTIGNLFNVKLINKTNDTLHFNFQIEGQEAHFDWVGHKQILGPQEMKNGELFIYLPVNALSGSKTKILLQVLDGEKIVAKEKLNFIGPNTHHQ
jgi:cytochrome c oxidase accessory protein FixG